MDRPTLVRSRPLIPPATRVAMPIGGPRSRWPHTRLGMIAHSLLRFPASAGGSVEDGGDHTARVSGLVGFQGAMEQERRLVMTETPAPCSIKATISYAMIGA